MCEGLFPHFALRWLKVMRDKILTNPRCLESVELELGKLAS